MAHFADNYVKRRHPRASSGFNFKSILQVVIRADKAFRDKRHVRDLPDYLLKDVGLRREDLD